ncbi:hypothetical protein F5Y04DRAFT_198800 [Hypomontagnella monticulosa]|nr:hypothetical protein F5Y04DRAFT_198800 [Hypomontagnella monticulosa]
MLPPYSSLVYYIQPAIHIYSIRGCLYRISWILSYYIAFGPSHTIQVVHYNTGLQLQNHKNHRHRARSRVLFFFCPSPRLHTELSNTVRQRANVLFSRCHVQNSHVSDCRCFGFSHLTTMRKRRKKLGAWPMIQTDIDNQAVSKNNTGTSHKRVSKKGKTEGRSEEGESQRRDTISSRQVSSASSQKRARTLRITGCRNPSHRHLTQPAYTNFPIAQRDFDGPVVVHGSRLGEGDDELALHIALLSFFVFRAFHLPNLTQIVPPP